MEQKHKTNSKKTRMAVLDTAPKKAYKPKKNTKNQNTLKSAMLAKVILTMVIILFAFILIIVSGAFQITEILVEGNKNISEEQIISFSGLQKGTNLFAISKKSITNKLKENAYIDEVKIKRVLPNKISLIINERKPEYVLQLANSYVYINRKGFVLEISNHKPEVPIIIGFRTDLSNIKPNDKLQESDLEKMNMVIKIMEIASHHHMENGITKIDVSQDKNYAIHFEKEGKIAYLGEGSELNTRFLYIKSILKEQQGKKGEIFVNMDLNSEYVYFRESI